MQTVKSFTCLWVNNNFASLTSNIKDRAVLACHGANVSLHPDRFMRGRSALDPNLNILGEGPLQTHVPPGDNGDKAGRDSWDKASSSSRAEAEKRLCALG